MKLKALIEIASKAYPDRMIEQIFEAGEITEFGTWQELPACLEIGDTLALFLVREIVDSHCEAAPDVEQIEATAALMGTAAKEVNAVEQALWDERNRLDEEARQKKLADPPPFDDGDRIELLEMPADPNPIPRGTLGTVEGSQRWDSKCWLVQVRWDNGRSLQLCIPPDSARRFP